jgi:hypothetical protein
MGADHVRPPSVDCENTIFEAPVELKPLSCQTAYSVPVGPTANSGSSSLARTS